MKRKLQFGGLLIALGLNVGLALPSAAQNRNPNRPPQQQRQAPRQAPRQERRPPQASPRTQGGRQNADRPRNNTQVNRPYEPAGSRNEANRPPNTAGESGRQPNFNPNRPQNITGEPGRQPNFNPNRPPNSTRPQTGYKPYRDLSPAEKRSYEQFNKLPPQRQQQLRDAARAWSKLTPVQQNHIKNDVLPAWKQLPSGRRNAIQSRLDVLQNMPESARNQHLNDPNFTRGMNEEDKAMLRDLAHMHVGAPDSPGE
ncbi:MAG TPA: DUF3106 domain-containing protein [Candidatus Acidoferrum sp.]|nr:DUF3106 domain-containing protein [Candidatus Acidoferrum sp.]